MSGPLFERHFTVAEVNSLLPLLTDCFERIKEKQAELFRRFPELQDFVERRTSDFGFPNSVEYIEKGGEINQFLNRINQTGALLKDIKRGLVDFPHLSEGKEVFLCWELGEMEILYWHEIETGYAGRKPLY